jgi:hypothetical protein
VMQQSLARMQRLTTTAVSRLETILDDPAVSPAAAVSAAKAVLELALKAVTLEDLETRLARIEQAVETRKDAAR